MTLKLNRILVVMDDAPLSKGALATVLALAQSNNAEMMGLFIEDRDMLEVAALSFSTAIDLHSGQRKPFFESDLKEKLQARSRQAKRVFSSHLSQTSLRWTFEVVRGSVEDEITRASSQVDLISLSSADQQLPHSSKIRGLTQALIEETGLPLLLPGKAGSQGAIAVVYDASKASISGLRFAFDLARAEKSALFVLLAAVNAAALQEELVQYMSKFPIHLRILSALSAENLMKFCKTEKLKLLIMPYEESMAEAVQKQHFMRNTALLFVH